MYSLQLIFAKPSHAAAGAAQNPCELSSAAARQPKPCVLDDTHKLAKPSYLLDPTKPACSVLDSDPPARPPVHRLGHHHPRRGIHACSKEHSKTKRNVLSRKKGKIQKINACHFSPQVSLQPPPCALNSRRALFFPRS